MILEGDWSDKEVPEYFYGIQGASDKSKNLFNSKTKNDTVNPNNGELAGIESTQWSSSTELIT